VFRKRVPDVGSGDRKSSAADASQSDWRSVGTTRRLVPAERRALRRGTSTVEVSGTRYRGALPWRTLCVRTAHYTLVSRSLFFHGLAVGSVR